MKMNNEATIAYLEARKKKLEADTVQNAHLIAKIKRQLRAIQKNGNSLYAKENNLGE